MVFFGRMRIGATMAMVVMMMVVMMMVMVVMTVVTVRGQRMRNQVQESVAQQAAGRKAQEYFQESMVFVFVFNGYEEEHEKRQNADGHGRRQRFYP